MGEVSLYDILELPRDADINQIKKSYRNLARRWHPDKNKSADAKEKFQKLSEAFTILSDPDKRRRYDAGEGLDLEDFSLDEILQTWLDEILAEDGAIDDMMEEAYPIDGIELKEQFLDENTIKKGKFWHCKLCSFKSQTVKVISAHIDKDHAVEFESWAAEEKIRLKESFASFMREGLGFGNGEGFILPDGTRAGGDMPKVPNIREMFEKQLFGGMEGMGGMDGMSPFGQLFDEEDLMGLPPEASALMMGGDFDPSLLDPMDDNEMNAMFSDFGRLQMGGLVRGAPNAEDELQALLRGDRRSKKGSAAASTVDTNEISIGCKCGYSCGTESALQKHLGRFPADTNHVAQRTRTDGTVLDILACKCGFSTTVDDKLKSHQSSCAG